MGAKTKLLSAVNRDNCNTNEFNIDEKEIISTVVRNTDELATSPHANELLEISRNSMGMKLIIKMSVIPAGGSSTASPNTCVQLARQALSDRYRLVSQF